MSRFTTSPHLILENKGQVEDPVKFYLPGARSVLFFTPSEIVLNVAPMRGRPSDTEEDDRRPERGGTGLVLRITFNGAKLNPSLEGLDEQKGKANVVRAGTSNGEALNDIRSYSGVVYKDLYPGIDLECRAGKEGMQRTLVLKDGAKVNRVRFTYEGVESVRMGDDGQLELLTAIGVIKESPIFVRYQVDPTGVGSILARYTLQGTTSVGIETGQER